MEKCFNGHEVSQGIGNCPICGATAYPEEPAQDLVTKELLTLEQHNEILLKWIVNVKISNTEDRKNCSDMLTNARAAKRNAESKLEDVLEPSKKEIARIKGIFKPFLEKVNAGINAITKAMSHWDFEQECKQKESIEQATIHEINQETGEVTDIITQPVPLITKTTKSNVGSDTKINSFDIVITDANLVPRQYCDPSLVKLRAGFKLVDTIPGAQKVPKIIYQTREAR